MPVQTAILEPIPAHARHLFLDLNPGADSRAALRALAAACDGQSAVLKFTRPLTGGYYWCPPVGDGGIDLSALG